MKKFFILFFLISSFAYSQENFWSPYVINYKISNLIKTKHEVFYAVSDTSLLKSPDYGISWTVIYRAPNCPSSRLRVSISNELTTQNTIIINQYCNSGPQPVKISIDEGQNWYDLVYPGGNLRNAVISSDGKIYIVSDSLYFSTDKGISWNNINLPFDGTLGGQLEIDSDNNIYISEYFLVYINPYTVYPVYVTFMSSNGGVNWDEIYHGGQGWIVGDLNVPTPNDCFISIYRYGYSSQVKHYKNNSIRTYQLHGVNSVVVKENDEIFTSGTDGILYSLSNGQNWDTLNTGLPGSTYGLIDDSLGFLYTCTDDGIFKSNFRIIKISSIPQIVFNDTKISDTTYKEITLTNHYSFDLVIDSLKCTSDLFFISFNNDSVIVANDSINVIVGFTPYTYGEFSDNIILYSNDIIGSVKIFGISPIPTLIQLPFDAFGQVVLGDTVIRSVPFSSESINLIRIDSIFIRKNTEFFLEAIQYPVYIESNDTLSIDVNFSPSSQGLKFDTLVVLSNCTNSPFELKLFGQGKNPTDVKVDDEVIKEYYLSSNYPNPFNPVTTIEYAVPYSSLVTIKVYNLLGEELEVLVNEVKEMGRYKITFDGKNLTSGIYFYLMQAGHFNQVKKFILIK